MDKQELYVAASRSREETFIYATPEIQIHREEFAPASPHMREGLPHIAEAAERNRAQLAAHDLAQRSGELAVVAARISPPAYVKAELGERPSDPAKAKAWDRGVSQIEHYRQRHGITDRSARRQREGPSVPVRRPRGGDCNRPSEPSGSASMRRELGSSAEDTASADEPTLTYRRLKHRSDGRQPPAGVGRKRP